MIYRSPNNPNSHLTAKVRSGASFPTKFLVRTGLIRGKVLDFGCGLGADVKYLKKKKFDVEGYDPHYYPNYPFDKKYDTIICNYVLNVLLPEEQAHVLMAISELLASDGRTYYCVRRDLKRAGFRYNPRHNCTTYQCNVKLPFRSIYRTEHCEIYEYRPFTKKFTQHSEKSCDLCQPNPEWKLFNELVTAYSIKMASNPPNICIRVIPKRHVSSIFELSDKEQMACYLMVQRISYIAQQRWGANYAAIYNVNYFASSSPSKHAHIDLKFGFQ